MFHSNLCHFRDKARYWSKIAIFSYPTGTRRPIRGRSPSKYCHKVWYGKKERESHKSHSKTVKMESGRLGFLLLPFRFASKPSIAKLDDFLIRYDKDEVTVNDIAVIVEKAYHDITDALASCAKQFVPERKKSFYKYSGGMKIWIFLSKHLLIQIDYRLHLANRVTALFLIKDKKHDYNIAIVSDRVKELTTNFTKTSFMTLYLEKTALFFWKCWRSNFTSNNKCLKVEGNEHLYSPQVVAKS